MSKMSAKLTVLFVYKIIFRRATGKLNQPTLRGPVKMYMVSRYAIKLMY